MNVPVKYLEIKAKDLQHGDILQGVCFDQAGTEVTLMMGIIVGSQLERLTTMIHVLDRDVNYNFPLNKNITCYVARIVPW